jgi:hypothetical protein
MCEYWKKVKNIDPGNLVFLEETGVLLGLTWGGDNPPETHS